MSDDNDSLEHKRWVHEQDIRHAERVHDKETEFFVRINEAAINNANFALRTLVIINGGAAVAMLAFIGNLVTADGTKYVNELPVLAGPLMWFVWGVSIATLAIGLAYFTNYSIAAAIAEKLQIWEHPWTQHTTASKWWIGFGILFQVAAVIAAFVSLWFFIYGMYEISNAIAALAKNS